MYIYLTIKLYTINGAQLVLLNIPNNSSSGNALEIQAQRTKSFV